MRQYDFNKANAFVSQFQVESYQSGKLDQFTFAVKDLIDIAGEITGCGNPTWTETHSKALVNAVCVEQLLSAGAQCCGKTITDELAYGLIGENYFYGTPINPKAPDRVPGGSSSGSASAVACGLVDFALGTDTAGSTRVPASNCGIFGYRPSHGIISVAGVNPFAPTFDTVGVFAKTSDILQRVMSVLLGDNSQNQSASSTKSSSAAAGVLKESEVELFLLEDICNICDPEVAQAFSQIVSVLKQQQLSLSTTTVSQLVSQTIDYRWLLDTASLLQGAEIWSSLGTWVEEYHPEFGPGAAYNFYQLAKQVDRRRIQDSVVKRETFARALNAALSGPEAKILCFPTTPALAPRRNSITPEARAQGTYYPRLLAMDAISGLSRCPQITIPILEIDGVPHGFSILAGYGQDLLLSQVCEYISSAIT